MRMNDNEICPKSKSLKTKRTIITRRLSNILFYLPKSHMWKVYYNIYIEKTSNNEWKKNMIVQSRKSKIEKNYFSNKKILTIF
jgi:hypothetical protein